MHPVIHEIISRQNQGGSPFFLMAGPCVIEDEQMGFTIAATLKNICEKLGVPYIFKASYKKANRTKLDSFSGIGDQKALNILGAIRQETGAPIVTDIHTSQEAGVAAEYADILQIPAFLCRQTDLLIAAGETGKVVNIKKGQFLSPASMLFAVEKVKSTGNQHIIITERGTTFGYGDLVVDYRGLPIMQDFGVPVVLDVTHSLQQPNQGAGVSGGLPHLIETIAKAGIAAGADGIFIETHPEPAKAKSDGANMLRLDKMEALLTTLVKIRKAIQDA